jgi:DNA-directed RNA polymerase subunit RPC12/RpoP
MPRFKCKKCGNIFEYEHHPLDSIIHFGPVRRIRCPACRKSSFFNFLSSVKDPVTWPRQEKKQNEPVEPRLSEEELEKKRIEESKYERL